jgi:hypothetical protein
MATCSNGGTDAVAGLLERLAEIPATSKHKAKFALATDSHTVHAESLNTDDPPLVCEYNELADHFGYFSESAGISTVRQNRGNVFDIKAAGRLNRLHVELLCNNPDWDGNERPEELAHFFARLIFCFFAGNRPAGAGLVCGGLPPARSLCSCRLTPGRVLFLTTDADDLAVRRGPAIWQHTQQQVATGLQIARRA